MIRIVSGGQTGVDRAALDAAIRLKIPCGGFCPKGRKAEDGIIPAIYPLTEVSGGYEDRTFANVKESDGTLIVYFGLLKSGTKLTVTYVKQTQKPFLLIDCNHQILGDIPDQIFEFTKIHFIQTLNVAGPRQSQESKAYPMTFKIINAFLELAVK